MNKYDLMGMNTGVTGLKIAVVGLALSATLTRTKADSVLKNARDLSGRYPKSHALGNNPPEITVKQRRAAELPDAESKAKEAYDLFWGLERFRKHTLRKQARTTQLAYGFLRGVPYNDIEDFAYSAPDWTEIEKTAMHYSNEDPRDVAQRFERWMQEAQRFDVGALA